MVTEVDLNVLDERLEEIGVLVKTLVQERDEALAGAPTPAPVAVHYIDMKMARKLGACDAGRYNLQRTLQTLNISNRQFPITAENLFVYISNYGYGDWQWLASRLSDLNSVDDWRSARERMQRAFDSEKYLQHGVQAGFANPTAALRHKDELMPVMQEIVDLLDDIAPKYRAARAARRR